MNIKTITLSALFFSTSLTLQANPISRAEARQVAQALVGIDDATADDGELSPYYVFSRGKGQGWVIVSGDDSTAPILGYTEQGDFDASALPPQLVAMLEQWHERLSVVQQSRRDLSSRRSAPMRAIASFKKDWSDVSPLVKTHWHQTSPYNDLAPVKEGQGRCMTGCVATAGSQVTYYFHKDNPGELAYDTPTYSYGTPITVSLPKGTPIEWDQMRLSGSGTARQNKAVATLMYALGTSAWLTYGDGDGTAPSGHNEKMADAMRGQFRLESKHKWKTEYSQQAWEELIYKNLTSRRPMLYSGANSEGGHSVVLDGYQASTGLYHFNFGWGGQGDGYYTVDDETGMHGFNTYQDLVFDITPKLQNLAAEVNASQLYHKVTNDITVTVKNNGTLDYSGISVYTNTQQKLSSGSVAGTDLKTVLVPGKSVELSFTVKPTQQKPLYIFVCDKNRRAIDTCVVDVLPTEAQLTMNSIAVDGSPDVTVVDGLTFHAINSTTASVSVNLTNSKGSTICEPTVRCFIDKYDRESKTWEYATELFVNLPNSTGGTPIVFHAGETREVVFAFDNLSPDVLYRARMDKEVWTSTRSDMLMTTADSMAYFTVRAADLAVSAAGRVATVTGRWNGPLFSKMAADATVCSYDLSGVTQLNSQPVAANPNALFYAATVEDDALGLQNIVAGGVCQNLVVQSGAEFLPSEPFTATRAKYVLASGEAGKWLATMVPFPADVPYGMQVKQAATLDLGAVPTLDFQVTRHIDGMSVVTCLTGHDALNSLEAEDVAVGTETETALFDGHLRASTLLSTAEPGTLVPGEYLTSLYFVSAEAEQQLLPFTPALVGTGEQRVRTTTETLADSYYRLLSRAINSAYEAVDAAAIAPTEALMAELKAAEDMLTYRSHGADTDIKAETERLQQAVNAFSEESVQEIDPVEAHAGTTASPAVYYNLKGQRIGGPQPGVYIIRQGKTVRKAFLFTHP